VAQISEFSLVFTALGHIDADTLGLISSPSACPLT